MDMEPRALPGRALDSDPAAHQLRELATDGEPEAAAAESPTGRFVGLGERLEDLLQSRGVHADAGVADRDVSGRQVLPRHLDIRVHRDLTVLGELDRVAHEIHHDLPYPERITDERPPFRRAPVGRRQSDGEPDSLGLDGGAEEARTLLENA